MNSAGLFGESEKKELGGQSKEKAASRVLRVLVSNGDEKTKLMKATVDSGAAIPIVPRTLVKQILEFWRQSRGNTATKTTFGNDKTASLRPSDERIGDIRKIDKIKIIYGNSTFEFTEHVVFLGKIIGEAFIVEKGSEILLAVTNIIENGWKRKVVFDEQKVEVLDSENKVIISGLRDPFTGLWSLDLQKRLCYTMINEMQGQSTRFVFLAEAYE